MRALFLTVLVALPAVAAERSFPFTWQTATLEPGKHELQSWLTPRLEREEDSPYSRLDLRFALATGVTQRLESMVTLDLDFESMGAFGKSVDPRLSWQWRYRFLGQDDALGVALLTRVGFGFDATDLEGRLVLDKRVGRAVFAVNAMLQQSALYNGRTGPDTRLEETAAARFALAPSLTTGIELRVRTAFEQGAFRGTSYALGPTLSFSRGPLWLVLGLHAQVAADKADSDRGNGEPLTLRDDERFTLRLLLGYTTP